MSSGSRESIGVHVDPDDLEVLADTPALQRSEGLRELEAEGFPALGVCGE
jgi:hypothetical protein